MNEAIKDQWVARLRNPELKQTQSFLGKTDGSRCCLGVLCDLAVEQGIITREKNDKNEVIIYDGIYGGYSLNILPTKVSRWAQIQNPLGSFIERQTGNKRSLLGMNDDGRTFEEIADVIEQNWEEI